MKRFIKFEKCDAHDSRNGQNYEPETWKDVHDENNVNHHPTMRVK